jgi:phosphoglucomutase
MKREEIPTFPYTDQRPGTAGLRKKVVEMQRPHYLHNFVQSIFDCVPQLRGATLILGGDGRFWNREAIHVCIQMAAANGISRVVVGKNGLLSTPAASHLIRKLDAHGGLILTASHNPAGPDGDFGIKFNVQGGGQAPAALTDAIHARASALTRYLIAPDVHVDIDQVGITATDDFSVQVINGVDDYLILMRECFDFDAIAAWLRSGHRVRFDALHAVTGPYARRLWVDALGGDPRDCMNDQPLEDFGGGHPDPNLVYARELVDLMMGTDAADLGAASDGDGDRNMILGPGLFVSPGDSLAMLADNLHYCPGYTDGVVGIARSMPTSRAADAVAAARGIALHETPTGWKFFCNLLDAGQITLCGEESFGTGSTHVREKDGLWAVLAWANILAATGLPVGEIARRHWQRYGRHYFQRHDYEDLDDTLADEVAETLRQCIASGALPAFGAHSVTRADEFSYSDPIDGSSARQQGLRIEFGPHARIVLRKSGTGTQGATLRLYLEAWSADDFNQAPEAFLAPLAHHAEQVIGLKTRTGRAGPDVVT